MKLAMYSRVRYVGRDRKAELLESGDIGYIIEDYGDGNYEVEFSNSDGTTRTLAVVAEQDLERAEIDCA